jgi:hopanoid biosynthesis associated protein HpnK
LAAAGFPRLIDWRVRRLIVNADDFGLTRGVNRAVLELHHGGVLSSATLMARAAAAAEAIKMARASASLSVGCHVVLVDGEPALPPGDLPTLCDQRTGLFCQGLGGFAPRALAGKIQAAEIEAEAAAQIALLQGSGLCLTHVDTHKHTHMFPVVLRALLRAARAAGIGAVRNPFEPAWSRRATPGAPLLRRMEVALLHQLEPTFRRIVAEAGFTTTDGALGVLATGTLDAATVLSLLMHAPEGTWELVTHPGYNDEELALVRTRLRQSRETEREALAAVSAVDGLELISFAKLVSPHTGTAAD